MAAGRPRSLDVFLNCPFDDSYKPLFNAIVFAIHDLGFVARCAFEIDDASVTRLEKIMRIVEECAYGVHDLSSVALSAGSGLPRFNMPLELGLYLGCKRYGGEAHREKACLILDSDPYRYRASISDISGQDIHSHGGEPKRAIEELRNWLVTVSRTKGLPGGGAIAARYEKFLQDLPLLCHKLKRELDALTFSDFFEAVEMWLNTGE